MAKVMIGIETKFEKELITLRKVLVRLSQKLKIENISSVYELNDPYPYGLCAVILINAKSESPVEVYEEIKALMDGVKGGTAEWVLMTVEDVVFRSPQITLPYPLLHKSPKWVVPAVDIQDAYVHPVLNQSLRVILNAFESVQGISFFKQNKTLLDFLQNEK